MKLKLGTYSLLLLLLSLRLNAQSQYQIVFDRNLSPVMGAEVLTTGNFIFSQIENEYLKPKFGKEDRIPSKALGITYRLAKSFYIDKTFHDFIRIFQREVFGHGARAREFGWTENYFRINFPQGGGRTYYGTRATNRIFSGQERLMRNIGGMESTMLLANTIRDKWFQSGKIQLSETYLFARSFLSLSLEINASREDTDSGANRLVRNINSYHQVPLNDSSFSLSYLKKRAKINFYNPLPYYTVFLLLKNYIWQGQNKATKLPMIRVGKFKYLPMYRMGVSPHGTEIYIENFLKTERSLSKLYLRLGDRTFGKHWGLGVSHNWLIDRSWIRINASANLWQQPEMILGGSILQTKKEGLGAAAQLGIFIKLFKGERPASLYAQMLYKSAGYLEGEALRKGFFLRAGAVLDFQTE